MEGRGEGDGSLTSPFPVWELEGGKKLSPPPLFPEEEEEKCWSGKLVEKGSDSLPPPPLPLLGPKGPLDSRREEEEVGRGGGKEGEGANPIACPEPFQKGEGGRKQSVGSNVFQIPTYGKKLLLLFSFIIGHESFLFFIHVCIFLQFSFRRQRQH